MWEIFTDVVYIVIAIIGVLILLDVRESLKK
jgi:hypothetical protein